VTTSAVDIARYRAGGGAFRRASRLTILNVVLVVAAGSAATMLASSGPGWTRLAVTAAVAGVAIALVYLVGGLAANVYSSRGELLRAFGTASIAGAVGLAALDRFWLDALSLADAASLAATVMLAGVVVGRTALIPACGTTRPRTLILLEGDGGPLGPECERLHGFVNVVKQLVLPASSEEVVAEIESHQPELLLAESGTSAIGFDLLRVCSEQGIRLLVLVRPPYSLATGRPVVRLAGLPWVAFAPLALAPRHLRAKRALDLGLVLLAAPAVVPLMGAVALAIAATSRGSVLYRQWRIGEGGRHFILLKFRTMRVDAERETGPVLAARVDPRTTRVGHFLRRSRLDELPQLWNVLRGEMSLVGPRPERPELVDSFAAIPDYHHRHLVRPGLTGLAQLIGGYSSAPADKLRCDLLYLSSRSLRLDLRLIGATAMQLLRGFPDD
jgi:lipopolysaccharide/colanic/teichoic acid biosynthesis glycosyltransferase